MANKIKTTQDLLDSIDDEYAWRFKEIDNIKDLLQRNRSKTKLVAVLSRSLVVISYSHWEGFVKSSAELYFSYLRHLALNKNQLNPRFLASCIHHLSDNKKAADAIEEVYKMLNDPSYKFEYNDTILTSAESNLNYSVLSKISSNMGLDISSMSGKSAVLDSKILKRRNDVAHGDRLLADYDYGVEVGDAVIDLMNQYKDLLQNMITVKGYQV